MGADTIDSDVLSIGACKRTGAADAICAGGLLARFVIGVWASFSYRPMKPGFLVGIATS